MKKGGMRWSEDELANYKKQLKENLAKPPSAAREAESLRLLQSARMQNAQPKPTSTTRLQALGRLRDGSLNKTEQRYADHLDVLKQRGEILWWKFEGIKLKLADRTHLTVDFAVMLSNGMLQMHDVKGAKAIVQDDARAKAKIAATTFPFAFFFVYPEKGGGWTLEEI